MGAEPNLYHVVNESRIKHGFRIWGETFHCRVYFSVDYGGGVFSPVLFALLVDGIILSLRVCAASGHGHLGALYWMHDVYR